MIPSRLRTLVPVLAAVVTLSLSLLPGPLAGQSLLSTQGLGFPLEPLDARSRALGSMGLGLSGAALLPTDPAAAAGLRIPTVNISVQPLWGEGDLEGDGLESRSTRFPLMGLAYPVSELRGMVTLTFGGFMDQRWEVEEERTLSLGDTTTQVTDIFKSDGGVSAVRIGWSQRLRDNLSVGLNVGTHTGSVRRTFIRSFDSLAVSEGIQPFRDGGKWQFSGLTGSVGVNWNPSTLLRVAGSVTWSGDLDAEPGDDTKGEAATFALPLQLRVGASGLLTPRLILHLSASRSDWGENDNGLQGEAVEGPVWGFGGGVEWEGPTWGARNFPLRLGYRYAELPFLFQGAEPSETAFSAGLGLNLTRAENLILAGMDLGVERGERDAGILSETFWRGTVTFRVAGW
jgi:hypothetical protein